MKELSKVAVPFTGTSGFYSSVMPDEQAVINLSNWALQAGFFLDADQIEDLHATIIYSPVGVPILPVVNPTRVYTARFMGLSWWPGHDGRGWVVATLESKDLARRHDYWKKQGCVPTFEGYQAHITLASPYPDSPGLFKTLKNACQRDIGTVLYLRGEQIEDIS